MILNLRTLTPLHIGDGSQLHAFDYTIHEGRFYRTSQHFFERFLDKVGANAPTAFADWSDEIVDEMEALESDRRRDPRTGRDFNQKMSALRKRHTLREFAKKIGQERAFLDLLREQKVPALPMQAVGKADKEKQEIRGFQRGADGMPFLPGSSVKGSIRTALLYHFLEKYADKDKIGQILQEALEHVRREKLEAEKRRKKFNVTRLSKSFGDKIEYLAFFAGMVNERGKSSEKEAQDDLMRCLLVSDTILPIEVLCVENIDLYLVKKLPKGQGLEAQRQSQAPAVEAILPNTLLPVRIDFNADLLLHLHRHQGDKGMPVGKETHFVGWRARAEWLFNLTDKDFNAVPMGAKSDDPTVQALRDKAIEHIVECCRRFTQAQADALQHWKANFQKHDRGGMARELDAGTAPVFSATGARLHLGFATGFEGMTVVLHLLARHKTLFAEIMDALGLGDSPSAWKNRRPGETYRSNPDRFPNSRRLATRPAAILPMGWLEWADDPKAGTIVTIPEAAFETEIKQVVAPRAPQYLRGTLKIGAKLDAELVGAGNPGRFKLFIQPDNEPVLEVKYPAGFKESDLGRIANILVKNLKGKEGVDKGDFMGFK